LYVRSQTFFLQEKNSLGFFGAIVNLSWANYDLERVDFEKNEGLCLIISFFEDSLPMKILTALGEFGYLIWQILRSFRYVWKDRKRITRQLDHVGVRSILLVLLIGIFAGAIIAWQAAYQFQGMVSMSLLGGQVIRVVMMEMAPVLTALVISGRIGASMTAEIGAMKITDQLTALETMAIDPIRYIAMPRFLGLALMMPVLTLFSVVISVLGAFAVSTFFLDITQEVFFASIRDFFSVWDLIGGLIKGAVFGMIISLVGCYKGLQTRGGAAGLGEATIASFVNSAVGILASDFFLWIILF
jgi:phospholipid/cholesterol/gamma-HCH transport system permease protein